MELLDGRGDVGRGREEVSHGVVPGGAAEHVGGPAHVHGVLKLGEVRSLDPLGDLEIAIRRKEGNFCMLHTLLPFLHAKFKGY